MRFLLSTAGAEGKVLRCSYQGSPVAVKVTLLDGYSLTPIRQQLLDAQAEAILLSELAHPHILRFFGLAIAYPTDVDIEVYTVLELCTQSAEDWLITKNRKKKKSKSDPTLDGGKISHIEKLTFCTSVASGMAFLHSRNIAHRDLKLSNVLLGAMDDPSTAKIADFGLSKTGLAIQDVMERTANVGTPVYMAVSAIKLD